MAEVRLYLDHPLDAGQPVVLSREQAHYLFSVMRLGVGDVIAVFNGRDGEWRAEVAEAGKKKGILIAQSQTRPQMSPPDLWLMFAPIKKARTDFIVEKSTEMGAARIMPLRTEFTNSERIRQDRLQAHAIEAAEQCGGIFVPPVSDLSTLDKILDRWPEERRLIFCDEEAAGQTSDLRAIEAGAPAAILVGPEGGFSPRERARLKAQPGVVTLSLGPRILRADTAVVAALTLWQSTHGDWQ